MSESAPPMQPVMVRMSSELYQQLKLIAGRDERTISQVIRLAVKQYLARNDEA